MTGRGPFKPTTRGETPEDRVDRLINDIYANPDAAKCAELRAALQLIPNDQDRQDRASEALDKCK